MFINTSLSATLFSKTNVHHSIRMLPISSPKATGVTNTGRDSSSLGKKYAAFLGLFSSLICRVGIEDYRKIIHSIKVGVALVLVSLLYLLQPLYNHVGDNAMWAVMTVVVVFEFTAGKKQSKGSGSFGPSRSPKSQERRNHMALV